MGSFAILGKIALVSFPIFSVKTMAFSSILWRRLGKKELIGIKQQGEHTILSIFVQAGAKNTGIVGIHGDWLKIRIAAPRVEGQANEELLDYLSNLLHLGKKEIVILKGEFGKYKLLKISYAKAEDLAQKIQEEINRVSKGNKK